MKDKYFRINRLTNMTFASTSTSNSQLSCLFTNYSLTSNLPLDRSREFTCHDDDLWCISPNVSLLLVPRGGSHWKLWLFYGSCNLMAVTDFVIKDSEKEAVCDPAVTNAAWLSCVQLGLSASCSYQNFLISFLTCSSSCLLDRFQLPTDFSFGSLRVTQCNYNYCTYITTSHGFKSCSNPKNVFSDHVNLRQLHFSGEHFLDFVCIH